MFALKGDGVEDGLVPLDYLYKMIDSDIQIG